MPIYQPPLRDMRFVLHDLLAVEACLRRMPAHAQTTRDLIDPILEAGSDFCARVLAPLNAVGDTEGCSLQADGSVRTPTGFKAAWDDFRAGGWNGLACSPEHGGQGLPSLLRYVLLEPLNAANLAWTMYPGLALGVYDCLEAHGTADQKAIYCPRLAQGDWAGTMCLTEPQSGTDLGLIRTRAVPAADGSYRISGTKVFISSGEHDLAENIVHLVLARLPDAPAGTRGISLFVVPKFLPEASGAAGERNGVRCNRVENKMGLHGNATCELRFEAAQGWLVGTVHQGLRAMFVMMNGARIAVALMTLGLMDAASQNALAYARERLQGRALTGAAQPGAAADPILVHADVRRMLLTQRAYTEGSRAFVYWLALNADIARHHESEFERHRATQLLALLTPVAKAFVSDAGVLVTHLAMQVWGGHGYIEENGLSQGVRDARINPIYEGTNGVQALDLLGRKLLLDGGEKFGVFVEMVGTEVDMHSAVAAMGEFTRPLATLLDEVQAVTGEIAERASEGPDAVGAAASDYLRLIGHLTLAYFWTRMAAIALAHPDELFHQQKLATARFYFAKLLPETQSLAAALRAGAGVIMQAPLAA